LEVLILSWAILVFWAVLLVVMYLVMVFPQRKADKKKKSMISALKIGDELITIGGVHGRVVAIREKDITIQFIDDKARAKIEKWAVREITKQVEEKTKKVEKIENVENSETAENSATAE
jgi:preprotein translocase subunit YajC